jgi:hypothetical protein
VAYEIKSDQATRRYVRLPGPFDGYEVGPPIVPVLIYNLNLGGGFVNFTGEQPREVSFVFKIMLPNEGAITVNAETVYRNDLGVAVRFVDVDADTSERLLRTVEAVKAK